MKGYRFSLIINTIYTVCRHTLLEGNTPTFSIHYHNLPNFILNRYLCRICKVIFVQVIDNIFAICQSRQVSRCGCNRVSPQRGCNFVQLIFVTYNLFKEKKDRFIHINIFLMFWNLHHIIEMLPSHSLGTTFYSQDSQIQQWPIHIRPGPYNHAMS